MYWFLYQDGLNGFLRTYIYIMVFAGAVTGVVRIQTSCAIWVGRIVTEALHICNEHFEVISAEFFAYKIAIQDGGFANG